MSFSGIIDVIDYRFRNAELLRQALTHRSHNASHNERLEFLGDAVLNCVVSEELFRNFPHLAEGELSRLRAALVNQDSLCARGREIGLGERLLLGEGELKSGGLERPSILADALEALIGAVLLDGGHAAAYQAVVGIFGDRLKLADSAMLEKDPKTLLQELLQERRLSLPRYSIIATGGSPHERTFRIECSLPDLGIRTKGEGASRRSAEQAAAREAYELALHADAIP